MQRVVSLYLPTWPTDRFRRLSGKDAPPVEKPLVMIGRHGSRRLVLALDKAAKAAGIRPGTPVSKAQALVPGLIVEDLDADGDSRALQQLAFHFLRIYAPIVAADPPDGLVLDTAGADHLHGNEALMLSGMVNRLHAAGFSARAAIADSWGAAHALARFGREAISIVPPGGQRVAVSGLPLAALRLEERIVSELKVLGFRSIGELADAPRAPLTLRFGPELVRRLSQALGEIGEPIEPVRVAELVEVRRAFPEPIAAAETIARYTQKLVAELCVALEKRGLGARRVDLVLEGLGVLQDELADAVGEGELGVGVDVHLEDAVGHGFADLFLLGARAAVEDQVQRFLRRLELLLHQVLRAFEDLRTQLHVARRIDAVHVAKRCRDREVADHREQLEGLRHVLGLGVELGVVGAVMLGADAVLLAAGDAELDLQAHAQRRHALQDAGAGREVFVDRLLGKIQHV